MFFDYLGPRLTFDCKNMAIKSDQNLSFWPCGAYLPHYIIHVSQGQFLCFLAAQNSFQMPIFLIILQELGTFYKSNAKSGGKRWAKVAYSGIFNQIGNMKFQYYAPKYAKFSDFVHFFGGQRHVFRVFGSQTYLWLLKHGDQKPPVPQFLAVQSLSPTLYNICKSRAISVHSGGPKLISKDQIFNYFARTREIL